jgi:DNA-binding NarL/FixJ family response regulator
VESDHTKTSILIVNDHNVVAEGLKSLFHGVGGYEVVSIAKDGEEAIRLISELKPNIVICEVDVTDFYSSGFIHRAKGVSPDTKIIIFSAESAEKKVLAVLRAGAMAFVLIGDPLDEILRATKQVMRNHYYLSTSLTHLAAKYYIKKHPNDVNNAYDALTWQEREVLQLASRGYSNSGIAELLEISLSKVEIHRSNLVRKLILRYQGNQLREYAIKRGILHEVDE